jgi:hypothetical protein
LVAAKTLEGSRLAANAPPTVTPADTRNDRRLTDSVKIRLMMFTFLFLLLF